MTFQLSSLGHYRIERSEEYDECPDGDKTYCEMIRVKGSKYGDLHFNVPSHLYKFSETELALYLKDRKNLWNALGEILNQEVDTSESEAIFIFPVSRFADVAGIIPFVRKRGRSNLSLDEKQELKNRLKSPRKMKQTDSDLNENHHGHIIALETLEPDDLMPGGSGIKVRNSMNRGKLDDRDQGEAPSSLARIPRFVRVAGLRRIFQKLFRKECRLSR